MRQSCVLAYLAPKRRGGKRMGTMEGDKDLWLSGAEIFLLGTICLSFSFCQEGTTMRKRIKELMGGGVKSFP